MKNKAIELTVLPDGEIRIDAVGFAGPDCEKATAFLEKALGSTVTSTRKPEYFARAYRRQKQRIGQ